MSWIEYSFEAIGTHWQISFDYPAHQDWSLIRQSIADCIKSFENTYSRFRADSLVGKIAEEAGVYVLPAEAKKLLALYHKLYQLTAGAFTPLIGQALVDAGYDKGYSLESKTINAIPTWDSVLEYQFPQLLVKHPVQLDFGAAGKGYLVDLVSEILREQKIVSFCVDAGGDIFYQHAEGQMLKVGLEHPADPTKAIGVATLLNKSICGSAGNRRAWGDYHHIINPTSLASPRHILATWVVADETIIADALATCLFFVDHTVLAQHYHFDYVILYADYALEHSPAFPGEFFIQ